MLARAGQILGTLLLIIGLLAPGTPGGQTALAQEPAGVSLSRLPIYPYYFPETGHYLSGRFRQYWEEQGGLAVFGLPLTAVYDEVATDGQTYQTQYFERARFEYHPANTQPFDVLLTRLGAEVAAGRLDEAPFLPAEEQPDCGHYPPQTRHNICGAFGRFWHQYGGLANFGHPLSEAFGETSLANGQTYTVQYFERARFELHPALAGTPHEVQLGQLGLERLGRAGAPARARAPEASPPPATTWPYGGTAFPARAGHLEYGFNTYLIGNDAPGAADFNRRALERVREAGFGWVRLQLIWRDFEPTPGAYDWAPLDLRIATARAQGAQVLLSVTRSPAWASPSMPGGLPEDRGTEDSVFGQLLREVARRYTGQIGAYEIWNEPNLASEVGGYASVKAYFQTLKVGFLAVKSFDPSAVVLFGGLASTSHNDPRVALDDTAFLRQFYELHEGEGRWYFDALASHPYGAANPPEARYPERPGSGDCPPPFLHQQGACYRNTSAYYFRRVEDQRAIMEHFGDGKKQIWLTEFGWTSCQGLPMPAGYEYCLLTSEEQQADYAVRAFQLARERWPWVGVMFLWNLNYAAVPNVPADDEKNGWSVLRADGTPRPSFEAVKRLPK